MKIKTLFYTNRFNDGIKPLLKSLEGKGYDYSFIGMNTKFYGFGSRNRAIKEYVDNYLDNTYTHVLVLDPWDLIIIKSLKLFIQIYKDNFKESDIIFSAETNCYPDKDLSMKYPFSTQFEFFRYLNAGSWIAPIKDVEWLCNMPDKANDQLVFTYHYLAFLNNDVDNRIILDHNCELFQTLYGTPSDLLHIRCYNNIKYKTITKTITNTITLTQPCILHGNGKYDMSNLIKQIL